MPEPYLETLLRKIWGRKPQSETIYHRRQEERRHRRAGIERKGATLAENKRG